MLKAFESVKVLFHKNLISREEEIIFYMFQVSSIQESGVRLTRSSCREIVTWCSQSSSNTAARWRSTSTLESSLVSEPRFYSSHSGSSSPLSGGDTSLNHITISRTRALMQAGYWKQWGKWKIIFDFTGKIALPDWEVENGKQKIAIPAEVFLNHVANLHCEKDEGFSREFEKMTLTREKQFSTVAATLPGNRDKNRYNNVLPCE